MLTDGENMTALVLAGWMAVAFLLAFAGISLWMALRRPGTAPGYSQAANWVADPWAGAEDDTDLDYYDTPSGNIWRPAAQPGRAAARLL